jgi:hypothetical protein
MANVNNTDVGEYGEKQKCYDGNHCSRRSARWHG